MRKLVRSFYPFKINRVDLFQCFKICLAILLILVSTKSFAQVAAVNPPTGGFNINGRVVVNSAVGDWTSGTGGGGFVLNNDGTPVNATTTGLAKDLFGSSSDSIFSNGSKFNDYISALKWSTGSATGKDDINNGMYHVSIDGNDHQWIFIASDRAATTGTSYIDFELLQGTITMNSNGTFSGSGSADASGRTLNDINVSMEYTNGGTKPNVVIYRWHKNASNTWFWDSTGSSAITNAFAETNRTGTVDVPFSAFGSTTYQQYAFVEAAVDVTQLLGNSTSCTGITVQTVWVKTKAAATSTAALKDFMRPIPVHFEFTPAHITSVSALCRNATPVCLSATPTGGTFTGNGVVQDAGCASGYKFDPSQANVVVGSNTITYHVTIGGSCLSEPTINIQVAARPVALILTGSSICTSVTGNGSITSSTSVVGINYQLYNNLNVAVQSAKAGTGSGLNWSNVAAGTGYYAIATGASPTNCTSANSNAVSVIEVTNPAALSLTGSSICSANPNTGTITSSTSGNNTVSYQLYNSSNQTVQAAKLGTGAALQWTGLAAGTGYYVVATGASPTNCTSTSNSVDVTSASNPTTLSLTGSSICSANPNTGTVSSTGSQLNVSYQLKDGSNGDVQAAKAGTGSALIWSSLAVGTGYHVVSTGAAPTSCAGSSNSVNVSQTTNPAAPAVSITEPSLCGSATATLTVTNPTAGTYTLTQNSGGINPAAKTYPSPDAIISFSGLIPGKGYNISVNLNGCVSTTSSCPSEITSKATIQSENVIESQTTVKAYPNPFSDRIKFVVTSPVAGKGNLEVYNMMGQKVKTVYQGFIFSGTQTFEMSLQAQQIANLIYVLRIGDKKISGKILQINR